MPPDESIPSKSLDEIVRGTGAVPAGGVRLRPARPRLHGASTCTASNTDPDASRHVSGPQLCEGLRDYALKQWGLLARTVLRRWSIRRTDDFGKIVFTLVENGHMSKTEDDRQEDFHNVFDFATAFDAGYQIGMKSP